MTDGGMSAVDEPTSPPLAISPATLPQAIIVAELTTPAGLHENIPPVQEAILSGEPIVEA